MRFLFQGVRHVALHVSSLERTNQTLAPDKAFHNFVTFTAILVSLTRFEG